MSDDIRIREFEYLLDAIKEFFSQYLKGFGFYFIVLAGVAKLMFDFPQGSSERLTFFAIGILLNSFALFGTLISGHHYLRLGRMLLLSKTLGIEDLYFPALAWTGGGFFAAIFIMNVLWFYILRVL